MEQLTSKQISVLKEVARGALLVRDGDHYQVIPRVRHGAERDVEGEVVEGLVERGYLLIEDPIWRYSSARITGKGSREVVGW